MDFITFSRKEWKQLTPEIQTQSPSHLLSNREITDVFQPLTDFLHLLIQNKRDASLKLSGFLRQTAGPTPFIIGIAGSVAAGKSTTAKILSELLSLYPEHAKSAILSTDHFLYPNRILEERGIMNKKGFPESYDYSRLHGTLKELKGGANEVQVPVYSHVTYDILPEPETIQRPDILFVEGINVLQASTGEAPISDSLDVTLYVDASVDDLFQWYWNRILALVKVAPENPHSYFHRFTGMDDDALFAMAKQVWEDVNLRNLNEYIFPTRERADIILKKGQDHIIESIRIKKKLI